MARSLLGSGISGARIHWHQAPDGRVQGVQSDPFGHHVQGFPAPRSPDPVTSGLGSVPVSAPDRRPRREVRARHSGCSGAGAGRVPTAPGRSQGLVRPARGCSTSRWDRQSMCTSAPARGPGPPQWNQGGAAAGTGTDPGGFAARSSGRGGAARRWAVAGRGQLGFGGEHLDTRAAWRIRREGTRPGPHHHSQGAGGQQRQPTHQHARAAPAPTQIPVPGTIRRPRLQEQGYRANPAGFPGRPGLRPVRPVASPLARPPAECRARRRPDAPRALPGSAPVAAPEPRRAFRWVGAGTGTQPGCQPARPMTRAGKPSRPPTSPQPALPPRRQAAGPGPRAASHRPAVARAQARRKAGLAAQHQQRRKPAGHQGNGGEGQEEHAARHQEQPQRPGPAAPAPRSASSPAGCPVPPRRSAPVSNGHRAVPAPARRAEAPPKLLPPALKVSPMSRRRSPDGRPGEPHAVGRSLVAEHDGGVGDPHQRMAARKPQVRRWADRPRRGPVPIAPRRIGRDPPGSGPRITTSTAGSLAARARGGPKSAGHRAITQQHPPPQRQLRDIVQRRPPAMPVQPWPVSRQGDGQHRAAEGLGSIQLQQHRPAKLPPRTSRMNRFPSMSSAFRWSPTCPFPRLAETVAVSVSALGPMATPI